MIEDVDIKSVYEMISFIPVPKETYEAMCFQLSEKSREIARLKNMNKPMTPAQNNPLSYPKQNKTYYCGDCGKKIAKGDKYCRECGRAVWWGG